MRSNFYIIGDDGSLEINPKCYEPTQDNLDNPKTARSAPQIKLSDDYFQKVYMYTCNLLMSMVKKNVTGLAKTGHVGTKYISSHNRLFLSTSIEFLHSVNFIVKTITCLISNEHCMAGYSIMKSKLMMHESLTKSAKILCAHMSLFSQAWSQIWMN